MGIYQPLRTLAGLARGDIVRHRVTDQVFTVTGNYGDRVTAAATADLTNPSEWEVFRMPTPETGGGCSCIISVETSEVIGGPCAGCIARNTHI